MKKQLIHQLSIIHCRLMAVDTKDEEWLTKTSKVEKWISNGQLYGKHTGYGKIPATIEELKGHIENRKKEYEELKDEDKLWLEVV